MLRALALSTLLAGTTAFKLPAATSPARSRTASPVCAEQLELPVPKTVDDAKVAFNREYGRPVGMAAQGFVGEMISSTVFALQAPSYRYSRIFAVGLEALCKVFLAGQPNDADREAIRSSMCIGLGMDPAMVRRDSEELLAFADGKSAAELLASDDFTSVGASKFKYTYCFGAGLTTLMNSVGVEPDDAVIDEWCGSLNMPSRTLQRDFAYYKTSLEKMDGMKEMMLQMQAAAKRSEAAKLKKAAEEAEKEAAAAVAATDETPAAEAKEEAKEEA